MAGSEAGQQRSNVSAVKSLSHRHVDLILSKIMSEGRQKLKILGACNLKEIFLPQLANTYIHSAETEAHSERTKFLKDQSEFGTTVLQRRLCTWKRKDS